MTLKTEANRYGVMSVAKRIIIWRNKMEGYCVKCKAKREIQNPVADFNKRGSAVVYGTCPECGTKIYRIGRTELHEGMEAPKK